MTREATKEKVKKVSELIGKGQSLSASLKEVGLSAPTYYKAKGDAGRAKIGKTGSRKRATRTVTPVETSEKITVIIGSPEQIRAYLR